MLLKRFFISMLGSLAAIWISAMLIIVLCMMFAISSIVSFSKTETTKIHHHSILCLDLNGPIDETVEMPTFMQIVNGEMNSATTLSSIVDAIAAAKTDSKIEGLYIKANGSVAGMATRQAVRQAVESFRESGKWVVAYGDSYSQGDYYIATAADEVFLNPVGEIGLEGLATGIPFFKGLLDKLGVEMQVVKVGTFKSAVEPFLLDHMSEANRLQTSVYLDGLWSQYTEAVAKSRGISVEQLNQMADSLATVAEAVKMVDLKLVDGLKYTDEITDYLKDKTGREHKDDLRLIGVSQYLSTDVEIPHREKAKKKIAVYYAAGDITTSDREGIASDRVVPDILDLADDDDIKAMVLRVNSGGGSAFASEQIWHALEVFKSKGKKLYVSMGDYAASGGYYISCGADKIYAQPTTLTGSIGIFGMIPCFNGLLTNHMGVNIDFVTTNANGAQPNSFEPMSPFVRQKMQSTVNQGYELFTSRCAEGRHMTQDSIKAIAEGRVWDGTSALHIGLVDKLGSLDDAIADLAAEMGYSKYQVVDYPSREANFMEILNSIAGYSDYARVRALREELGQAYPLYQDIRRLQTLDPIQARMERTVIF